MKHRVRRHIFDQLVCLEWATGRLVSSKGANKDYRNLPDDLQEAFNKLAFLIGLIKCRYEPFLWCKAVEIDESEGGGAAAKYLPDNMRDKIEAMKDYAEVCDQEDASFLVSKSHKCDG